MKMIIAGFEFAEGARFQAGAHADPMVVGPHLEMLRRQKGGELTAQDVLDDARNANSPLHPYFEWNDGIAAEQHRLAQARSLIRSVVAIYKSPQQEPIKIRAYVHINEKDNPHYREVSHAMNREDTRKMVLKRALSELASWRKRYRDLKEFADVIEVIDLTTKKLP